MNTIKIVMALGMLGALPAFAQPSRYAVSRFSAITWATNNE